MRRPLECKVVVLLRRSCCCDGAAAAPDAVALILHVASLGRDAQNDETSIHFDSPHLNLKGRGPQS